MMVSHTNFFLNNVYILMLLHIFIIAILCISYMLIYSLTIKMAPIKWVVV